jgi:MFS family permease
MANDTQAGAVAADPAQVTMESQPAVLDARPLTRLAAWTEAKAMFIVCVAAVIVISLQGIPSHFSQDGWLGLIAGRQIAAHGIPQHDYFTHMAYGVRWVDQQWLAQLAMYELERLGGMQLLTVVYVLIAGAAAAAAVAAARSLGGEDLHVLIALVAGAVFYLATAITIRTQGFAYPLFVATLWLLASEIRSPIRRRRVYWVFPMLVVWANLHGSVTLGVGLAILYGVAQLVAGVSARGVTGLRDPRSWAFIVISPLTLLATPYGTAIVHYYRATLANPQFSRIVTEWKPVTSVPVLAIPLFAMIAGTLYTFVRGFVRVRAEVKHPPLFDVLVLVALAVGAVDAVRNITWFGLAVVILLPAAITQMRDGLASPLRRARVNRLLAIAMTAIAALAAVAIVTRPDSWFTSTYPSRAVPKLKSLIARDPNVKIFADVRYSDWLIWKNPQLFSGRVAYDTSLELLTPSQLSQISDPVAGPKGRGGLLAPYGVWVLYPSNKQSNRELLKRPGVHVVMRTAKVIIVTHPVAARPA